MMNEASRSNDRHNIERIVHPKEKIGTVKKYVSHPTATSETTPDETKLPLRDNSTTTIK